MKTALYVATVARTYRKAIDDFFVSEECYRSNMEYYKEEISKCTYRQFTTGFYFQKPDENTQIYDSNTYVKEYTYIGMVEGSFTNKDEFKDILGENLLTVDKFFGQLTKGVKEYYGVN